ncbi:FAD-dependent oxidoreductase [Microbacterium capsulatum]|uniref:FAD-dependent oxidoreductase n=1 Tax=Microbacterium capsulatum TaxID=3041921 RepID=A0ABU0XIL6_9MICO|nr:FAD-dependent oxidoreductase [Microbacterium sp. ASV81]MDQ4214974.1 FAD-dependent oxidoreductase [Microbacterium sp. ASV81]
MNSATTVVIGGGIAGVTTAFQLARRGARVTVIDDGGFGQATAASAGIIAPWVSSSDGSFYEAYSAGGGFYPEFLSQLEGLGIPELGYRRSGALMVGTQTELDGVEERIRSRVAAAGSVAGEVARVDSARARELFPPLATGLGGITVSGGGRVDGRILRDAALSGAIALGAAHLVDAVIGIEACEGSGWRVRTTTTELDVDAVVVAAGARVRDLLAPLGTTVGVSPQRGQIVHLGLRGVNTSPWPTLHPFADHYMTPFDGGRIAVGATRETGSGFDARVTAAGQMSVLQKALALAPGLAGATILETRVGIRPMGDDGVPLIGRVPGADGLWLVAGYGAGGLTMGPLFGDAVARDVMGEAAPELAHFGVAAA